MPSTKLPKIYLGEAIGLVGKTLPLLWVRLGSYLALGAALGVYAAAVGAVAWLLGRLWAPLGVIVFLIAVGGAFGVVRWAGRYWFHMLRAAHTAVLTEFIVTGKGPEQGQLAYGKAQVLGRFKDTSILFAVDLLVGGVVKFVVRTFTRIASILPIPGLDGLAKLLERVAVMSTTYVDEAVLSRAYAKREENVWAVARDGVVLYAQAWKPILANAVVLALLSFVEFLVFLLILGLPAAAIAAAVPSLGLALGIGVLIGAWMLKLAVSDAIALAATLLAYHRATAGLEPDPAWVAKLDSASDKFRELGRKAVEAVKPAMTPTGPQDGQPATTAASGQPVGAQLGGKA
ncbi:MAG TPA: hypothetical protein VKZ43_01070 [Trueperaceae bacterium]|nr:hypothetical protein [Trueperaceae bacterium]